MANHSNEYINGDGLKKVLELIKEEIDTTTGGFPLYSALDIILILVFNTGAYHIIPPVPGDTDSGKYFMYVKTSTTTRNWSGDDILLCEQTAFDAYNPNIYKRMLYIVTVLIKYMVI